MKFIQLTVRYYDEDGSYSHLAWFESVKNILSFGPVEDGTHTIIHPVKGESYIVTETCYEILNTIEDEQ